MYFVYALVIFPVEQFLSSNKCNEQIRDPCWAKHTRHISETTLSIVRPISIEAMNENNELSFWPSTIHRSRSACAIACMSTDKRHELRSVYLFGMTNVDRRGTCASWRPDVSTSEQFRKIHHFAERAYHVSVLRLDVAFANATAQLSSNAVGQINAKSSGRMCSFQYMHIRNTYLACHALVVRIQQKLLWKSFLLELQWPAACRIRQTIVAYRTTNNVGCLQLARGLGWFWSSAPRGFYQKSVDDRHEWTRQPIGNDWSIFIPKSGSSSCCSRAAPDVQIA